MKKIIEWLNKNDMEILFTIQLSLIAIILILFAWAIGSK